MNADEQKQFYDSEGYLVVERLFDDDDLRQVRDRIEQIISDPSCAPPGVTVGREGDTDASGDGKDSAVRGIAFLARFDPEFRDLALTEKLLTLVRRLIGPRIKVFRDQALMKPPGGQAKPMHQDQSYFVVRPIDALLTAWLALDEATTENGCMEYVPGSHVHGIFPVASDPDRPVHHVPDPGDVTLRPVVACPVPAGSVIFHHGCTLHRSADNVSPHWRKALIFHYSTADAVSDNAGLNGEVSVEID